jgi:hypothetical protein
MASTQLIIYNSGQYIDLPAVNDEQVIFYCSEAVTLTKLLCTAVNEAIACDTIQAQIDVGIDGDDNAYIAAFEPTDNALEGTMIDMTASLLTTSVSAGTKLVASVKTAGTDSVSATGQLIFHVEATLSTT